MLLKPVFPVIEYAVNYDYISKALCVNKGNPQIHCNGKCYLMKEMAKESESEKPFSPDKKSAASDNEILFFQVKQLFDSSPVFYPVTTKVDDNYSNLYTYLNSSIVFHPPTFND